MMMLENSRLGSLGLLSNLCNLIYSTVTLNDIILLIPSIEQPYEPSNYRKREGFLRSKKINTLATKWVLFASRDSCKKKVMETVNLKINKKLLLNSQKVHFFSDL